MLFHKANARGNVRGFLKHVVTVKFQRFCKQGNGTSALPDHCAYNENW